MIAPVFDLKDAAMPVFDFIFVTGSVDGAATSAETDAGQVTTLSGDVNFAVDSDQLTDRAREVLNDLAAQWNAKKPTKVTVVGHTDSVADDSHNLDLSKRRAKAVGDYLNSKVSGLSLTTDGKGESEPIADESEGSDEEKEKAKAANRRVEITAEVPE
ncbi:MAG: cell envelope biogenesis protein OmpA [Actinobacteria bacterium]|nr:MAG: cell envelope biogenesis protein OmpA [Actinomycetota bacterium]